MTDAPERIWAVPPMAENFGWGKWFDAERLGGRPYIRADLTHDPEQVAALVEAARRAEDELSLTQNPVFADPAIRQQIEALGQQHGYGNIMATASALWRQELARQGLPEGGAFSAGPCVVTAANTLRMVRAALAPFRGEGE